METSEGDSLLLSVIEDYCITETNTGTAIANINTLTSKKKNSLQGTGYLSNAANLPMTNIDEQLKTLISLF